MQVKPFRADEYLHGKTLAAILLLLIGAVTGAHAHGDIELQIEMMDQEIEANISKGSLYLKRAELQRRHLSWELAVADYSRAEKHGISAQELNFFRGRMYLEAEQYESAISYLDASLKAQPNHVPALIERAKIPIRPISNSIQDLDKAIDLSSAPTPDLFLNRAKLVLAADPEQFQDAISGLQEGIIQIGPVVSLIEFAVDQCALRLQWELAMQIIEYLPPILKQSPKWLLKKGLIHWELRNYKVATDLYSAALAKIEELPAARSNSSAILLLKNEVVNALGRKQTGQ